MGDVDFSVSLKQTVKSEAEQAADGLDHMIRAWNAADKVSASGAKGFGSAEKALGSTATGASAAAKALGSTSKALGATEKAAKGAAKGLGATVNAEIGWAAIAKKQSNAVQAEAARRSKAAKALAMDQAKAARTQSEKVAGAARFQADMMDKAFGIIGGAAKAAGAAILAVGAATAALGGKVLFETFKGSDFASGVKGVYSILTKSTKGGEQALQDLLDVALKTSAPLDELNETYGALMQAGFSRDQAKQFTEVEHNVRAISREPDVFRDKMRDAMKELKLSGKISETIIEDLGEQLGGPEKMWDALSNAMGKSKEDLVEMAKAGQFKDLDALFRAAGELGKGFEGASKAAKPWEQRLGSIKDIFFTMLGEQVEFGAGDLFDKAEAWLKSDEGKGKIKEWGEDIQWVVDKVEAAWPIFQGFGIGVSIAWDMIKAAVKPVLDALGEFFGTEDDLDAWSAVAAGLGFTVAIMGASIAGALLLVQLPILGTIALAEKSAAVFLSMSDAAEGGANGVVDSFNTLYFQALGIVAGLIVQANVWGAQIVDAITGGISSKTSAAVNAMRSLATRLSDAFEGALRFGSPPKVFTDMGSQISTAVGQGVEGDASAPEKSMGKLAGGMQATMENDLGASSASGFFGSAGSAMGLGLTAPTTDTFAPAPMLPAPSPEMFANAAGGTAEGAAPGLAGGGNTINLTMNVSQQPGEDGESFAQRVTKILTDRLEGELLAAGV